MLRLVNRVVKILIRLGLVPKQTHLLTVRGRKTGKPHSTPVTLVEEDGQRWLVAPYGEVGWVRNARAAGQVTLTRKGKSETVTIAELGAEESAPVLRMYVTRVPITQPYFDARPDSPLEAFVREADRHPVFRIEGPAREKLSDSFRNSPLAGTDIDLTRDTSEARSDPQV
jgi:deazaflavin-dependent oxidoreductase (nitroreductase family)